MLKISNNNNTALVLKNSEPYKIVETVKEYISNSGSDEITIDISHINLIDACKISVLCSTEMYLKNPQHKINWVVASQTIELMTSALGLGNSSFITN